MFVEGARLIYYESLVFLAFYKPISLFILVLKIVDNLLPSSVLFR